MVMKQLINDNQFDKIMNALTQHGGYVFIAPWLDREHNITYSTTWNGNVIEHWIECDPRDWMIFVLRFM